MLRIMEIDSEEKFKTVREKENATHDYLYILKYCNQIKMSDNGTLKNFTNVVICETQEEYDNITTKEDIMYLVNADDDTPKLYYGSNLVSGNTSYTDEEIDGAIDDVLATLNEGDVTA